MCAWGNVESAVQYFEVSEDIKSAMEMQVNLPFTI